MAVGQDLHQQVVQTVCFLEPAIYGQYHYILCNHVIKVLPVRDKDKFTSVPNDHLFSISLIGRIQNNCLPENLAQKCLKFIK
jgi:hypothetical protein